MPKKEEQPDQEPYSHDEIVKAFLAGGEAIGGKDGRIHYQNVSEEVIARFDARVDEVVKFLEARGVKAPNAKRRVTIGLMELLSDPGFPVECGATLFAAGGPADDPTSRYQPGKVADRVFTLLLKGGHIHGTGNRRA